MCERAPSISLGSKICNDCRKKLAKVPTTLSFVSEIESESEVYVNAPASLTSINQCLGEIGATPVSKYKLKHNKYSKQKVKKITTCMDRCMHACMDGGVTMSTRPPQSGVDAWIDGGMDGWMVVKP